MAEKLFRLAVQKSEGVQSLRTSKKKKQSDGLFLMNYDDDH